MRMLFGVFAGAAAVIFMSFNITPCFANGDTADIIKLEKKVLSLEKELSEYKEEIKQLKNRMNVVEETAPAASLCYEMEDSDDGLTVDAEFCLIKPRNQDLNVAISDNDTDTNKEGDFVKIKQRYTESPKIKLGYIFPSKTDRVDCSLWTYRDDNDIDVNEVSSSGQIWNILADPDAGDNASDQVLATHNLRVYMADLVYTKTFRQTSNWVFDWFAGARYADMRSNLHVKYVDVPNPTSSEYITSDIDSKGCGPRVGLNAVVTYDLNGIPVLEFLREVSLSAGSSIAFLVGNTSADLFDEEPLGTILQDVHLNDNARVFPIIDMDIGLILSPFKDVKLKAGYSLLAWFNALTQAQFVDDVRDGASVLDKEDVMFDGFNFGVEYIF